MSNKKITDLTELTTPTTDDVFPVVDIATNTTQKVQLGNLPTTPAVTSALASKQATLVSGTNIKTVNGTSVLGSGDINIPLTPPSGVSGAIQFSTGSAFASDAANLFWDDTNNRLGIGTNAPTTPLDVNGTIKTNSDIYIQGNAKFIYANTGGGSVTTGLYFRPTDALLDVYINGQAAATFGASTRALIKGSGSTSATTSLLVQNSAGTEALRIRDNANATFGADVTVTGTLNVTQDVGLQNTVVYWIGGYQIRNTANGFVFTGSGGSATGALGLGMTSGTGINASAILQADSTTKGFLPPRMTTTQKNAIASPLAGLQVYDTTTNKLCCYNGSTWNDLF